MPGFWDAFWPSFWATIPATFIGVGGALAVGYVILQLTVRHQRDQERQQLVISLRALHRALVDNCNVFATTAKNLDEGHTPTDTYLDVATWEAVRAQIASHLEDYQLLGDIGAYYASVAVMARLHDRLLDLTIGTPATLPDAPAHRLDLQMFLSRRMKELRRDAELIAKQLEDRERAVLNQPLPPLNVKVVAKLSDDDGLQDGETQPDSAHRR